MNNFLAPRSEIQDGSWNPVWVFHCLVWLADQFGNITLSEGKEPDVKKIRDLLDEDSKVEEDLC